MEDSESTERITMGGLLCWPKAFSIYGRLGEKSANTAKDHLERFDVIHVNYTPRNASYISALRESLGNSDTKIIANVDYAIGMWSNIDPYVMKDQLLRADLVFHVEPIGAAALQQFLGVPVPTVPHPSDVSRIKEFRQPTRLPAIAACQYHRYMYTWHPYFYALREFPELLSALMNVSSPQPDVPFDAYFNEVFTRTAYEEYIAMLGGSFINLDLTPDYTYGRGIVDAAALGVPTIGSVTCWAATHIWPDLAVQPYYIHQIKDRVRRLITDPEFASEMSSRGTELSEHYNLENSYNRMVECLSASS
jgi:glycosyltransferase involved in cell wall biosynthesis